MEKLNCFDSDIQLQNNKQQIKGVFHLWDVLSDALFSSTLQLFQLRGVVERLGFDHWKVHLDPSSPC